MALEHVARVRDVAVPPLQKLLLFALASRADHAGRCWPSVHRICRDTGLSRRAVQAHLSHLALRGALVREGRRGRSNVYRLTLEGLTIDDAEAVEQPELADNGPRHMRTSCAPPAHHMHPPAHVMRGSCARRAPEAKGEAPDKDQCKPVSAALPVDKHSVGRTLPWWRSRPAVMQMGVDLGLPPRPGETYSAYKDRVYTASRGPKE